MIALEVSRRKILLKTLWNFSGMSIPLFQTDKASVLRS